ncbi:type VI secretion system-associated protein TagF [Vannielia litorea]|uniref:type VI secretion system-associated protein TagF n=1 Tax=Vannielia litorea TaxID=1217970 RepID=UPI001C96A59D|nr:type VI secretion system-associated protein TagF [Vannielia litorea]MBY6047909.1 type VI secretion system-associated protein TagF [Vannielia litorea]MBY6075323.1 type VI secretion system-associated protein TagF [Vannielia litorea]
MPLGLFGKLPAKGDFITRAMPPEVLSFWEGWLEKVMSGAKHHLAGEWGQVYEASPVWRFWIGPGVFGHAMAGALTASVDRVGRQFPLTLVLSGMGPQHPVPPLSDPMEDWYGMLERALLAAKSAHFDGDVDGFLAALPEPNAAPCALGEDRRNAFFAYGEHGLGQMLADVRDHDHQLAAFERSYWWTGGNDYVGPGMIALDGMPDAAGFMAMLRGFGPPARVQQPAAPPRPAAGAVAASAGAGAAAARPRETTVPPRDLIGDAEEAEAAAAWGAEASREELAWATPSDAVDDASWTDAITGDEAESPFDAPREDWDFPDAGSAKDTPPEPEPEVAPEPEPEPEPEEDLFDAGPEPYGIGGSAAEGDIYASLSEPDEEAEEAEVAVEAESEETPTMPPSLRGGAAEEAPEAESEAEADAPAEAPGAGAVVDVSMVVDEDFEIPGDEEEAAEAPAERGPVIDVSMVAEDDYEIEDDPAPDGEPEEAAEPVSDDAQATEEAPEEAEPVLEAHAEEAGGDGPAAEEDLPEGEDSPFGGPPEDGEDGGLGQKKSGLRGFFSLRGRGKD